MTVANHLPSDPKAVLQKEFRSVGLKAKEVLKVLPEWWEEAISHPSGVFEVRGFVAKHFGLEIGPDGKLRQRLMPHACFKARIGTDVSEIASARAMATAVAKIVASVTKAKWSGSLPSAAEVRRTSIVNGDASWVGLEDLLVACWSRGIPVIYMPSLPVTQSKMEGMVTICSGRPVIIVTKKVAPAWMLFVLAHEMGHVSLGHLDLNEGGTIVDEKVSEENCALDEQERAANQYALEVLTGGKNLRLSYLINAKILASEAKRVGRDSCIDPGHLILNAVRNTVLKGKIPWSLGNAALKHIGQDISTSDLCRDVLRKNIDLESLSDDSFEFMEHIGLL